jgi:hypothetical protein
MNRFLQKKCQRLADWIIVKLEKSLETGSDREFDTLMEFGLALDRWCQKRGIDLE